MSISNISEIDKGSFGSLSFIDNPIYSKQYFTTKCSALIVKKNFKHDSRKEISLIKVSNPRLGLLKAINLIYPSNLENSKLEYKIGENLKTGDYTYISKKSQNLKKRSKNYPKFWTPIFFNLLIN